MRNEESGIPATLPKAFWISDFGFAAHVPGLRSLMLNPTPIHLLKKRRKGAEGQRRGVEAAISPLLPFSPLPPSLKRCAVRSP
jgi:hypothetical protein